MKYHRLPSLRDPVWLVFVAPLVGRFFLATRMEGGWMWYGWNGLLIIVLMVWTWWVAGMLAKRAGLDERGQERFMVMSLLGAIAPPLGVAVCEIGLINSAVHPLMSFWAGAPNKNNTVLMQILLSFLMFVNMAGLSLALQTMGLKVMRSHHPRLIQTYRLTLIPLLSQSCAVLLFIIFLLIYHAAILEYLCLIIFILASPFLNAALFIIPYLTKQSMNEQEKSDAAQLRRLRGLHIGMLIIIGLYFVSQVYSYCAGNLG